MLGRLLIEADGYKISLRRRVLLVARFIYLKLILADRHWSRLENRLKAVPNEEGILLRRTLYAKYFKHIGDKVRIAPNSSFFFPSNIYLASEVSINEHCYLNGHSGIEIGERVLVGPYSMVHSANHNIPHNKDIISRAGYAGKKITIKKDSLISAHCCVLSGVTIGEGAVLGAGSVAVKNLDDYCVYGGAPARQISNRLGG